MAQLTNSEFYQDHRNRANDTIAKIRTTLTSPTVKVEVAEAIVDALATVVDNALNIAAVATNSAVPAEIKPVETPKWQESAKVFPLQPGQTELYQAFIYGEWDEAMALAKQPDQISNMSIHSRAAVVEDLILRAESNERIIWVLDLFGPDSIKQILDPQRYDVFNQLVNRDYTAVLTKMVLYLDGSHQEFLSNRVSLMQDYIRLIFKVDILGLRKA